MDSVDQAKSQSWSLWAKLAAPALLRCPVLGISVVLDVSTPLAAMARTLPRSQEFTSAEPTQRQLRVLHSYERYLARMRTQRGHGWYAGAPGRAAPANTRSRQPDKVPRWTRAPVCGACRK